MRRRNSAPTILAARASGVLAALVAFALANVADAAVVVISNRTASELALDVDLDGAGDRPLSIPPGESRPIFATSSATARLRQGDAVQEYALQPDCAYYVGARSDGALALQQIGLGEPGIRNWQPAAQHAVELPAAGVINVKILVDDDEKRLRTVWEPVIRARIDHASERLAAHCGLTLKVVAVDEWDSDDLETDFSQSMSEFEREVLPTPGMVAIGFSSQYQIAHGRVHLGGTRGPLHSHILIKERSRNVLEPERLELLVHELGHFLGATHSPEATSVMRPVIGQGLQRIAGREVQFDAPNTLLISLLAQEYRQRRVRELSGLSAETRHRMREIYAAIDPTISDDPASGRYQQLMAAAGAKPLVEDARKILQQITRVAKLRQKLRSQAAAVRGGAAANAARDLSGDELLEFYVRQAAFAAKQVRRENAEKALLLALGVALTDDSIRRKVPLAASVFPHIEGEEERAERLAAFGTPTMRGRGDLTMHYFASAQLVVLSGSEAARSAGLVKELLDSNGGSGFSFADMAANRAGIVFAHALLSKQLSLDDVAEKFRVVDFLPPVDDLREELASKEFIAAFGGPGDERFATELRVIEARIMALPVYRDLAERPRP